MTRAELISRISRHFSQLPLQDIEISVKAIMDAMGNRLANGGRIEIRGFGSFGVNIRPPRNGRNPKTGERVIVPERHVPHFKPGKDLKSGVNPGIETEARLRKVA